MKRREMCVFNQIFEAYDRIQSEEELTAKYENYSLAEAVRKRISEIMDPFWKMYMKGGWKLLEDEDWTQFLKDSRDLPPLKLPETETPEENTPD